MLELKNIKKSFSGVFEPVLKGINLSLEKGEFCVIIGANGSGKSTLMKIIGGEYSADSGEIYGNGSVFQVVQDVNKGTIPQMTMLENIILGQGRASKFSFYGRFRNEIFAQVKSLNAGLEKFLDQPLGTLSGGQRQTIATMIALNSGREILLLDEHTSALDPKMRTFLMNYTSKSIREKKLTTLMITHDMKDALAYGDRLILMHNGRIESDLRGDGKKNLTPRSLSELMRQVEIHDLNGSEANVD